MKTKEQFSTQQGKADAKSSADHPIAVTNSSLSGSAGEGRNVLQLVEGVATKPLEVEYLESEPKCDLAALLEASLQNIEQPSPKSGSGPLAGENNPDKPTKGRGRRKRPGLSEGLVNVSSPASAGTQSESADDGRSSERFASLNLRQKLALVRRRLGYIQKRGHNELHNYSYVTAADLAGAVGDILSELGVVVVPQLDSISHEAALNGRADSEHVTHVVMKYSFVDVDTDEDITVKIAGEGMDAGDKAPYKAMTGALKYALLQSFLLATGDDPEDERVSPSGYAVTSRESSLEQVITAEQLHELRRLIKETDTEVKRVLAYYKLSSLEQMTEGSYRRAVELLKQKKSEAEWWRKCPCPELSGSIRTLRNGTTGGGKE
jgi:hypothetical protein